MNFYNIKNLHYFKIKNNCNLIFLYVKKKIKINIDTDVGYFLVVSCILGILVFHFPSFL